MQRFTIAECVGLYAQNYFFSLMCSLARIWLSEEKTCFRLFRALQAHEAHFDPKYRRSLHSHRSQSVVFQSGTMRCDHLSPQQDQKNFDRNILDHRSFVQMADHQISIADCASRCTNNNQTQP